jgi:hypothetical protein
MLPRCYDSRDGDYGHQRAKLYTGLFGEILSNRADLHDRARSDFSVDFSSGITGWKVSPAPFAMDLDLTEFQLELADVVFSARKRSLACWARR